MKFFLKKPDNPQAQSLVQKIFQAATAENDNPDVRDRAYVYWRLLSSNPQVAQNVVLSEKPSITTTIQSLPPALLERLLTELSTLASVYHKPPESFIGQGRFGADAVQKAAIEYMLPLHLLLFFFSRLIDICREQMQNARENPLAAAAAAAAVSGVAPPQSNIENLLDIDFDGAAPASAQKSPMPGLSGLEGLAGTPQRIESPSAPTDLNNIPPPSSSLSGTTNLDDLMGLSNGMAPSQQPNGHRDVLGGLAGLDISSGTQQPLPPAQQMKGDGGAKKTNEDLLGLF